MNDNTGALLKKSIPCCRENKPDQSPEDRAEEMEDVLNWLRNPGLKLTDNEAPTSFHKVGIQPVIRRSPEERAKELDNGLPCEFA
jgi:hypothetical protein